MSRPGLAIQNVADQAPESGSQGSSSFASSYSSLSSPASPASPAQRVAADDPTPCLLLYRGDQELVREPLPPGRQLVLGRTADCDVRLLHPSVSRTHARIWSEASGTWIEDLGTVHGTTVNGMRLRAPLRLPGGARIELGRSAADGWLLSFEDPSLALLRAMGLLEDPRVSGEDPIQEGAAGPVAESADETGGPDGAPDPPTRRPATQAADQTTDSPTEPPPAEAAGDPASGEETENPKFGKSAVVSKLSRRAATSLRNPFLWCGAFLCLVTTATVVWAVRGLEPAEVGWRWVHLAPPSPSAGATLSLQSPDIGSADDLRLEMDGVEVVPEVAPGLLRFEVPELRSGPGVHEVPLVARRGDLEVFRVTVSYQVLPRIDAVEPEVLEAGTEAWVKGRYLAPSGGASPTVTVGDAQAEVLDWGAERLRIRVPDLDVDDPVRETLAVHVGSLSGVSEQPLEIRPRPPEPDPPFMELRKRHGSWWLAPRVGPMMCFGSRAAAARHLEAWHRLLDVAAEDPSVRLEQRRERGGHLLSAVGDSLPEPLELGRFAADQLRATTGRSDRPAGALAQWLVTVWEPLVTALGRGVLLDVDPSSGLGAGYVEALAAVVAARDRSSARHERPHHHLAEALPPGAAGRLAAALRDVPSHLGKVSGRWSGRLENVFFPGEGYRLLLDLDLHQDRGALDGTATLRLVRGEGDGIEFTWPRVRLAGELRSRLDQQLVLRARFARPVGELKLEAQVVGGRLRGVYQGADVPTGEARWKAERQVETATDW